MPEFEYYPKLGITVAYAFDADIDVGYWVDWVNGTGTVEAWKDWNSTWSTSRVF